LTANPGRGTFAINGLASPGAYTLTFTLNGYAPASVPVDLTKDGAPPVIDVQLGAQLGGITGTVTAAGSSAGLVGATVVATDGSKTWTTTSTAAGGSLPRGGYLLTGLQPGSYSVTASAPGRQQQTGIVTVVAGKNAKRNLRVGA